MPQISTSVYLSLLLSSFLSRGNYVCVRKDRKHVDMSYVKEINKRKTTTRMKARKCDRERSAN